MCGQDTDQCSVCEAYQLAKAKFDEALCFSLAMEALKARHAEMSNEVAADAVTELLFVRACRKVV